LFNSLAFLSPTHTPPRIENNGMENHEEINNERKNEEIKNYERQINQRQRPRMSPLDLE
jgi:hypothetical protein